METLFKSGEISKRLGVTIQTLRRWVHRYPDLFSANSKEDNRYLVFYTASDVELMATIQHLSSSGYGLDEIETQIRAGFREAGDIVNKLASDQGKKSVNPRTENLLQSDLRLALAELDTARNTIHKLEEKYVAKDQEIANLMREIAELKYQLGMTTGELNLLRRQTEQGR